MKNNTILTLEMKLYSKTLTHLLIDLSRDDIKNYLLISLLNTSVLTGILNQRVVRILPHIISPT
uniref:Uncharacterized protein n=1 Tax=Lepeophtheirus salmonis TaxID=72036 RepID=A0A0K2UAV7_LEPSM